MSGSAHGVDIAEVDAELATHVGADLYGLHLAALGILFENFGLEGIAGSDALPFQDI